MCCGGRHDQHCAAGERRGPTRRSWAAARTISVALGWRGGVHSDHGREPIRTLWSWGWRGVHGAVIGNRRPCI